MIGLGSAIGGAMKIGAGIFGGIKMAKAAKEVKANIQKQMRENQDWYDRRYNEDATQRADAQRVLTMTEESIKNRNKQAAGTQAVMGGTNESVAAARAANATALSDTMGQIAVNAEQRKDAIENQYMSTKANLNKQMNDITMQQAGQVANAVSGVANAAADVAKIDNLFGKSK